jgi:phage baseplate assembly protein W
MEERVMNNNDSPFLGTGWSFPPTFSRQDFAVVMVSGETDIKQSLHLLLSTVMGSRIMLPMFGCALQSKVFHLLTTTFKRELSDDIRSAMVNWEPRIDVDDVIIKSDTKVDGLLQIELVYTIRQTNSRSNLVYPFYFSEGTLIPENGEAS